MDVENSRAYYQENYVFANNCYVNQSERKQKKSESDILLDVDVLSDAVAKSLALYPQKAQAYIIDHWSIVFTPSPPSFATEYMDGMSLSDYSAVTVPDIHTIFVYSEDVESLTYILTHEFGHVLAYEYGALDCTKEFEELYYLFENSYKENSPYSTLGYATSSPSEFFASTMQAYVTEPEWLWKEAPGVADYMEELLKEEAYNNEIEHFWVRTQGLIRTIE